MKVLVDEPEDPLSYHKERHLGSTIGMTVMEKAEAEARGAVPCSQCFDTQQQGLYPFNYTKA